MIKFISNKHSKSTAQVLLKWSIQQHIAVIPKANSFNHLKENISLFDFKLDDDDFGKIASLSKDVHLCWNPDTVS